MSSNSTNSCRDTFFAITGVMGFIADAITLSAFISQVRITDTGISLPSIVTKLEFGSFHADATDLTLVLLIYVGIAFLFTSFGQIRKNEVSSVLIRFHLFIALVLTWSIVFAPLGNWNVYVHIAFAWLIGFVILLISRSAFADWESILFSSPWQIVQRFVVVCSGAFLLVVPAWTFFGKDLHKTTWDFAFFVAMGGAMAGIIVSIAYWTLVIILVSLGDFYIRESEPRVKTHVR